MIPELSDRARALLEAKERDPSYGCDSPAYMSQLYDYSRQRRERELQEVAEAYLEAIESLQPVCIHDDWGHECDVCGLHVDEFGNTEDSFVNCSYPNCGCPESRLCMAPGGCGS